MTTAQENLSLRNIKEGAAIERFDMAIREIMTNINDLNTDATATREINLKMHFKPTDDREMVAIGFQVVTKPAPLSPVIATAAIGIDAQGKGFAREIHAMQQQRLPLGNIHRIDERKGGVND